MNWIVAAPKMLFGRQLTAISPALFPYIVLAALGVLTALFLRSALLHQRETSDDIEHVTPEGWKRGAALFMAMLAYALLMQPIGFLFSTFLAICTISWIAGTARRSSISARPIHR